MELKLPANWDEIIAAGKYPAVIKILTTEHPDPEHCKYALFKELTGYDVRLQFDNLPMQENSMAELFLSATLVDEVFPMLDFITRRTPFYKNPLKQFKHECQGYYEPKWFTGPEDMLMNQTGEEWSISHHAEHMYKLTGDKSHLINLVAANYHITQNGGRSAFNEAQFETDIKTLADLPDNIIYGIYLWYQHADEWWSEKFPHLFAGGNDSKPVQATGLEVRNIIFELAGNKLDDAWDKVQKRTRQDIIYALDRLEAARE